MEADLQAEEVQEAMEADLQVEVVREESHQKEVINLAVLIEGNETKSIKNWKNNSKKSNFSSTHGRCYRFSI